MLATARIERRPFTSDVVRPPVLPVRDSVSVGSTVHRCVKRHQATLCIAQTMENKVMYRPADASGRQPRKLVTIVATTALKARYAAHNVSAGGGHSGCLDISASMRSCRCYTRHFLATRPLHRLRHSAEPAWQITLFPIRGQYRRNRAWRRRHAATFDVSVRIRDVLPMRGVHVVLAHPNDTGVDCC
jgi:hypothetical protein